MKKMLLLALTTALDARREGTAILSKAIGVAGLTERAAAPFKGAPPG
jgi:hypothetical protein